MLPPLSPTEWAIALAAVLVGAIVQGTTGFGLGIVSVPILALVDPAFVPVPIQVVSLAISLPAIVRERSALDIRGAALVLLGRIPGALVGVIALGLMTETTVGIVVGVTVLLGVAAMTFGWSIPITNTSQILTGIASGSMALTTGIGGPPVGMLYRDKDAPSLRSTLAAIFTFGLLLNLTTLALSGNLTRSDLAISGVLMVPVAIGFVLSGPLTRRVPAGLLRNSVLVLSAASAITLLVTIWLGR